MEQAQRAKDGPVEGLVGAARANRAKNRILANVEGKIRTITTLLVAGVSAGAVAGAKAVKVAAVLRSVLFDDLSAKTANLFLREP